MFDRAAIRAHVAAIFESLNLEVPEGDVDLFDTGVLDSLAFVQLLLQLEERLGVTVSLDDLEIDNFRTIEHIIDFVAAYSQRRSGVAI
ncbi:MAG: acyl carrier protein [Acidobacteria bacterium]|nr:acyl carrier protein [Acidobacteriota bacterium]